MYVIGDGPVQAAAAAAAVFADLAGGDVVEVAVGAVRPAGSVGSSVGLLLRTSLPG